MPTKSFPGRYTSLPEISDFVARAAQDAGLDSKGVYAVRLAVDEACTNVIEHAYGGEGEGDIRVSWHLVGDAFTITISDNGRAFDPLEVPAPTLPSQPDRLDELKIGGLGIHFMRKLMDEVRFSVDEVKGNQLVMIKFLSKSQEQ